MEIIKTEKGSLSVLGGKTDMGKSTIACYDCAEQLRSGKSVIFVSYEYCQSIIYKKINNKIRKRYDEIKNNYCKDNNIELIRIKQKEYKDMENIIVERLGLIGEVVKTA